MKEYFVLSDKAPFLIRLFCKHHYIEMHRTKHWPDPHHLYKCQRCGKEVERRNAPVNPAKESDWDIYEREVMAGNAHLVTSPPSIRSRH